MLLLLAAPPAMAEEAVDGSEIVHDENCDHAQTHSDSAGAVALLSTQASEPVIEEEAAPPGLSDFLFSPKYLAFFLLMAVALVLLLGGWINLWVRIGLMVAAFVLFGLDLLFPLHPSPMCAVTKLFMFKITWGEFFPAFLAMFIAIFLPSLIGRKLFCGWVCPLGALQELVNKIPFKFRLKKFSFSAFNSLRAGLFVMFILGFYAVKDHVSLLAERAEADPASDLWVAYSAFSIYEPINLFELLHWSVSTTFWVMMAILAVGSLVLYRPFCYLICPIGLLSWLLEKIAPGQIRVDHSKCNQCGICVDRSPCPTIGPMIEDKPRILPDCTSCGECLKTCPIDAITFGFRTKAS